MMKATLWILMKFSIIFGETPELTNASGLKKVLKNSENQLISIFKFSTF